MTQTKVKIKTAIMTSKPWCHTVKMDGCAVTAVTPFFYTQPWPFVFDLENILSNAHSHDEYMWQVSLKEKVKVNGDMDSVLSWTHL